MMLHLLQYDFIKSKKTMKMMLSVVIITSLICLIMKFIGSDENLMLAFNLELLILLAISIFGFMSLFESNYANRFLKDSIFSYTAIKKKVIFLECITFTIGYIAIASFMIFLFMMALFFDVQDQLMAMNVFKIYSDQLVLNMCMRFALGNIMILIFYCGILLSFWNIAKIIKLKKFSSILQTLAIFIVWGGFALLSKFIPIGKGMLIFISLGCFMILFAYILFMKKET